LLPGGRPQFPGFCGAKPRKTKKAPSAFLVRARDRSGIFALEGQKLERIARSCRKAAGCAQIHRFNRVGIRENYGSSLAQSGGALHWDGREGPGFRQGRGVPGNLYENSGRLSQKLNFWESRMCSEQTRGRGGVTSCFSFISLYGREFTS
jgi:hypothetical protein